MTVPIRFRFNTNKATALILRLLGERGPIGMTDLMVLFYSANRIHLSRWGRPILGAGYQTSRSGPMAVEMADLMNAGNGRHWLREGDVLRLSPDSPSPDLDIISESDMDALEQAAATWQAMTETERHASMSTLTSPEGQEVEILWEDMMDESPGKAGRVEDLRALGPYLHF